jgi:hypothetical protein
MKRMLRAEENIHRDEVLADYADFLFCSRLVDGMRKKQSFTHDISLRYENQALIDHIIATRRDETVVGGGPRSSHGGGCDEIHSRRSQGARTPPRCDSGEGLLPLVPSDFAGLVESINGLPDITETDDMIFDMEI